MKNFEEFAQHQWPTWAKRRGWIAEFPGNPPAAASAPPAADLEAISASAASASGSDADSGRVVQLDKDKWVFQRRRSKRAELPVADTVLCLCC